MEYFCGPLEPEAGEQEVDAEALEALPPCTKHSSSHAAHPTLRATPTCSARVGAGAPSPSPHALEALAQECKTKGLALSYSSSLCIAQVH